MEILTELIAVIFIAFCKASDIVDESLGEDTRHAVLCLLEDTPNNMNEIHLTCGNDAVINIRKVNHGYQDLPQDTTFCKYQMRDECSITDEETKNTLLTACMGQFDCNVPVKRIFLDECGKTSDYIQVEYQCIQEHSQTQNIIDICGDMLDGEAIARTIGYIESPNYPTDYPPDVSCMCSLKALQSGTKIKLSIEDIDVQSESKEQCIGDWLEYTHPGQQWGSGHRMCDMHKVNDSYIVDNNIELHFRADSKDEARGFWIKYEGMMESSHPVNIRVQCNRYHPSVYKEEGVCLHNRSETFLDCQDIGVIQVLGAEYVNRGYLPGCPVHVSNIPDCTLRISHQHPILEECMGQPYCVIDVDSVDMPHCGTSSNYFETQFKCVPDKNERHNIVDICGDALNGEDIIRRQGYIESPNYPHNFPPNTRCQCHLSTSEPETTIQFIFLDLDLTDDPTDHCTKDWLRYTTKPSAQWGQGIQLCYGLTPSDRIDTSSKDIYLNFNSDSLHELRGFWMQYTAIRIEENIEVPVRVSCYKYGSDDIYTSDGVSKKISDGDSDSSNTALIVGLSVVISLMIVFFLAMLLYKMRDSRKKYPTMRIDTPVTDKSSLDNSYNTMKRYSTLHEQSSSASSDITHRSMSGYQSPRHDEFHRVGLASHLNLPASYVNPVFDGSPVV